MLPKVARTGKMRLFALLSFFGSWSPCAPAYSCVVRHIHAYFEVFALVLASSSAGLRSLDLSTHFRPHSQVTLEFHPGIGNLHCLSLALFLKVMKRKSIMPVILSSYRLEQAGEHPSRLFPLLGTGYPQKTNWAGVMVIGPES